MKYILYHGSPFKFEKFEIRNISSAIEQNGPGIYLTTSEDEAYRYSEGKYIYKVEWEFNKILSDKEQSKNSLKLYASKVKKAFSMLDKDRLETILSNWNENINKAYSNLIETCIDSAFSEKDIFLNVWAEGYMKRSSQFCKMMNKLGYDGHIVKFDGINHIIAYNPDKIEILEIKNNEMLKEDINLPIKVGDEIRTGKFRNKKVIVKKIGTDEHGSPTVNGKSILAIRIPKIDPTKKDKKNLKEEEKINCKKCSWSWDKSEGGTDMYICHKCNNDNTPLTEKILKENENLTFTVGDIIRLKPEAEVSLSYKEGQPPLKFIKTALWIIDNIDEIETGIDSLNISTFEPIGNINAGSYCSYVSSTDVKEIFRKKKINESFIEKVLREAK